MKPHVDKHKTLRLMTWDLDGRVTRMTAPSLAVMRALFTARGMQNRLDGYCCMEESIWNRLDEELKQIEDDLKYQDDLECSADWYRQRARYRVTDEAKREAIQLRLSELADLEQHGDLEKSS